MDFKKLSNIKECRLFSHFSDQDIQELLSSGFASVKSYSKEDLLFSEGEYCDFLSVVIEGKIEIQKLDSNGNILVVATLNRGNVFGENLLFGDRNFYPMSVVAKENSQVLHIKKDYIYKLCSSNEAFLRELLRILSNKALNLSSKLKQVTMKSIREMICNYLLKKYNKEERMQKIDDLLDKLNLSLFKQSLVGRLSGGQSRRLDIAVQLLNEPRVILMDEPDSGLDIKSCRELYEILARLVADKNSTILVITHNTHMACKYPYIDDLLFMASQGRICFYGQKEDALNYFNINDLDDIYNAVENNQDYFVEKYNNLVNRRV